MISKNEKNLLDCLKMQLEANKILFKSLCSLEKSQARQDKRLLYLERGLRRAEDYLP